MNCSKGITKNKLFFAVAFCVCAIVCFGVCALAEGELSEDEKINEMLVWMEGFSGDFMRNGKIYTAQDAVKHIRKKTKYYFRNKPIDCQEFIHNVASHSWRSKKPYLWRNNAGVVMPIEDVLEGYYQRHFNDSPIATNK